MTFESSILIDNEFELINGAGGSSKVIVAGLGDSMDQEAKLALPEQKDSGATSPRIKNDHCLATDNYSQP